MKKIPAYLLGDGLKKGNQMLRKQERDAIHEIGKYDLFNPWEQPINDKSKSPTAEMIFVADTEAILKSEVIVADCDNDSVGSTTEIGMIWGLNYMIEELEKIVISTYMAGAVPFPQEVIHQSIGEQVEKLLERIPKKKVYWHTSDIRHTQIPEKGLRRSFSMNQFLYGCLLDVSGEEKTFDEILKELEGNSHE